jgi:hypothetical protein
MYSGKIAVPPGGGGIVVGGLPQSVNKCRASVCKIVEELCNKSIVLIVVKQSK